MTFCSRSNEVVLLGGLTNLTGPGLQSIHVFDGVNWATSNATLPAASAAGTRAAYHFATDEAVVGDVGAAVTFVSGRRGLMDVPGGTACQCVGGAFMRLITLAPPSIGGAVNLRVTPVGPSPVVFVAAGLSQSPPTAIPLAGFSPLCLQQIIPTTSVFAGLGPTNEPEVLLGVGNSVTFIGGVVFFQAIDFANLCV